MANTLKIKRGTNATIPQGQLAEPLFTTDTYDLYIGKGAGGNQRIQNYIASGTSSQFLKGDGTLDSTSYQPLITAGTTSQYYRGDKTFQTLDTSVVPENGPIYFTEPRVRATVLTGLNLSGGGTIAATDSILTAFGKVQNQISALVGGATYQGTWNANTNTPTLASGTGTKGYYYVVSVAGSTNLDGITDWKIGDWAIFNGTTWDKVDNTDAVSSVNGFTGAVNLALDNISDVSAASPTNAQLLRFNGTSSLWENWTPTFEPALTKGNLTEATSSVLTITGGTGAVIGSGTTIQVASAGAAQNGVVTTGTQTFAGAKTFSSDVTINSLTAGRGAGNDSSNTVFGNSALGGSTASVAGNTAIGSGSLGSNTSGFGNTALGFGSLGQNTTGQSNTAIGVTAGQLIIGSYNTFVGRQAFSQATSGSNNTIIGYAAGIDITSGSNNTLIGGYTGPASALSGNVIISDGSGNIRFLHNGTNGKLPFLTSNGFVKTSGGDGTLSVDTTSYLPLTGGTLTGALSGTSATFSGTVGIGTATSPSAELQVGKASDVTIALSNSSSVTSGNRGTIAFYNSAVSTVANIRAAAVTDNVGTELQFFTRPAAGSLTQVFTLASTGAATFSSTLTVNGNNVTIQPTTATTYALSVMQNTGGYLRVGRDTSTGALYGDAYAAVIVSSGAYPMIFGTNDTERFRIASTGAASFSSSVAVGAGMTIGISGTNDISWGTAGGIKLSRTNVGPEYALSQRWTGTLAYIDIASSTQWNGGVTILPNGGGNVGIGTTSPGTLLDVRGELSVAFNATYGIRLYNQDRNNWSFIGNSVATGDTAANIRFGDSTGEVMRITGGKVGIGTTSPSGKLDIAGSLGNFYVGTSGAELFFTRNENNDFLANAGSSAGIRFGAQSYLRFDTGTTLTERMRITSGGNVEISSGSIKTGAPSGGTAKPWKLGARLSGTVSTSTTNYLEVEVDGTLYYLAFAVPL